MREYLPPEILPSLGRSRKDRNYLLIDRPEWMDSIPNQALLDQLKKTK
jgi:hypothetical protein